MGHAAIRAQQASGMQEMPGFVSQTGDRMDWNFDQAIISPVRPGIKLAHVNLAISDLLNSPRVDRSGANNDSKFSFTCLLTQETKSATC